MIEMKPVKSSTIKAAGYDPTTNTLQLQFRSGATYRYTDVPQTVYDDLCQCESFGRFHAQNIKGKFKYARLPDEPEAA